MAAAKKPPKPPPDEPPADPAIAYRLQKGRVQTLFVMNADGSNQASIWEDVGNPCWAPDGSAIAFGFQHVLYRIDVSVVDGVPQGSNPIALTDEIKSSPPKWSPAGDVIAFTNHFNGEYNLIQTVPAMGGTVETIYTAPEGYSVLSMAWRSDASKMAIELIEFYNNNQRTIVVLDLSDYTTTTVYGPTTDRCDHLDWARTSDTLTFTSNDGISILDMTQTNPTPQVLIAGNNEWPIWSPDDSQMIYLQWHKNSYKLSVYTLSTEESEIIGKGSAPDWCRA
jgi:Tol biopolymer transport system component